MDVTNIYIPNLSIQTPVDSKPGEEIIVMKIKKSAGGYNGTYGSEKYSPNVIYEKGGKILYLEVLRYIYVMLQ